MRAMLGTPLTISSNIKWALSTLNSYIVTQNAVNEFDPLNLNDKFKIKHFWLAIAIPYGSTFSLKTSLDILAIFKSHILKL